MRVLHIIAAAIIFVGLQAIAQEADVKLPNGEPDIALAPAPVLQPPGADYGDQTRKFQGIPGIERAENGRLWATWYAGGEGEGPENYVALVTSGDDGKTWSSLLMAIDPPGPVRAFDPCLWMDPTGTLWLLWAQGYSHWDGRAGTWCITTDNADSEDAVWTAPRRIADGIMMNKPTVLKNGDWLYPVSVWRHDPNPPNTAHHFDLGEAKGANVICTRDEGETFFRLGQALSDKATFDEHMIVEQVDGSLWMLLRTPYGIAQSSSLDGGKTWTDSEPSTIPHTSARFFIRRLKSGKLMLVKHAPFRGRQRSHLTAFLSDDDGRSWYGGLLIDERTGVSYPDAVETDDGTIYLTYDFDRRGEMEILMATFTEADVATGTWTSPVARQRVRINKATGRTPASG
jgi:hypothetical protein